MVRRLPGADFRGQAIFRALALLILTVSILWQGCSDNPVTPRKSVVGVWEVISMKQNGEEVNSDFVEIVTLNADSTGYSEIYLDEELFIPRTYINWHVNRDSISITPLNGGTYTHWYSCTADRLTLRRYIDGYDQTYEVIFARIDEE